MQDLAELMKRLLEIQSGERQRSPELTAEDERLMDGIRKRALAERSAQTIRDCQGLRTVAACKVVILP
jgi:hypothetical protein